MRNLIFFIKSLKNKKKKLVLTLFYHADRVGQFKKAYLNRPIKVLRLPKTVRIQNCLA